MKIAIIPIDNRPVCYDLIKQICAIDKDLELFLPEKKFLGDLKKSADINSILNWLESLEKMDAIILSLDTIAYGGLVPSRRGSDSFENIITRLDKLKKILKKAKKVYACSSIMRISNNNVNEEEKEYWKDYGKKIFQYSYNFHKNAEDNSEIPQEILSDYLSTRQRNFSVNQEYLKWLQEGILSTLVFSKDDCAEFGLNVLEANILKREIESKNVNALVKTGADEIPIALLSRAIVEFKTVEENISAPKISTKFLAPNEKNLISNYEDISIEQSVYSQIELAKCEVTTENEDISLVVNNFEHHQGEIVMEIETKPFEGNFKIPQKPFMIADVRFANGADNNFVKTLMKSDLGKNFYGYSAWNTSANTLGSLICAGVVKFLAKEYDDFAFKTLQATRFLDDWAYQANVRQELKKEKFELSFNQIKNLMTPFEKEINEKFDLELDYEYYFPWDRFFEVGIIPKTIEKITD